MTDTDLQNLTAKKRAFLTAYAECGVISQAADAADVARQSHYDWMATDAEYPALFRMVQRQAADVLEMEARSRAVDGWDEPVFYEGSVCGHKRKRSDTLLIFLMKGAMPEKYGEKIEHAGQVGVQHSGTVDLTVHKVLDELQNDPDYVEFVRTRNLLSDAGSVGAACQSGAVAIRKTPASDRPSGDESDSGEGASDPVA